jgi:hypothetical protein
MNFNQHPREESQEERDEAYRALSRIIRRNLTRFGTDQDYGISGTATVLTIRTADGREADLTRYTRLDQNVGRVDCVGITLMQDGNVFGKNTDYLSINNGPFLRTDQDGESLGVPALREGDKVSIFSIAATAFMVADIKDADVLEGIDGFPIAAGEARQLIETIEMSKPQPKI